MSESKRLFFAVNLPSELRQKIFCELVEEIPKNCFVRTREENLHITLVFLGYFPEAKLNELHEKAKELENFEKFEAELNCIGHFKGRILWLGTGKGTNEFNLLARRICNAIGMQCNDFHAHVTLARNKGASKEEFDAAVEKLRTKKFAEKITVRGFDLMESTLTPEGPRYKKVFSIDFSVKGSR
ncbi:MAG: RNA 2',3'-cyclic phosphodiesterase [Candidatus Diapherotrites archaeon]|nr:RNA 2',3'-cyclic phosphodiesterase [Candidatus Diapherotrites archaeon]